MSKFSLINRLEEDRNQQVAADPNAPNITYQRYDIDVGDKPTGVLIPIRECDNFEKRMSDETNVTDRKLTKILREFRALRVREE